MLAALLAERLFKALGEQGVYNAASGMRAFEFLQDLVKHQAHAGHGVVAGAAAYD